MTGLHIEGARWDVAHNSLAMSLPNTLTEPLPILAIIPVEEHRLDFQVIDAIYILLSDRHLLIYQSAIPRTTYTQHICIYSHLHKDTFRIYH